MKDVPNFARIGQQKLLRGDNISTKSLNTGVGVHQMDDWRMRSSAKRGGLGVIVISLWWK